MLSDETLTNEISIFLGKKERFKTLQFLSRELYAFVWNPQYSQSLVLGASGGIEPALVKFSLERAVELWSKLKHLTMVGTEADTPLIFQRLLEANTSSLYCIELVKPSAHSVATLLSMLPRCSQVSTLKLAEAELESVGDLAIYRSGVCSVRRLIIDEIFLVRSSTNPSVVSSPMAVKALMRRPREEQALESLDVYILPFSEQISFLNSCLSYGLFPNLSSIRIRCLSSVSHADMLASVIEAKVPIHGWPLMERIDTGMITESLFATLTDHCAADRIKSLSFGDRIDVELPDLTNAFPLTEIFVARVKNNIHFLRMVEAIEVSSWKSSLRSLKISWSVLNSISVSVLVRLRIALHDLAWFRASARQVTVTASKQSRVAPPTVVSKDAFQMFFVEICKDRIVCECDECGAGCGDVDETHVLEMAQDEWNELDKNLRNEYVRLFV